MRSRGQSGLTTKIATAIEDLKSLVRVQFPDAKFEVGQDPDNPAEVLLYAIVDVDESQDIFERVLDPVIGRILALQSEEGLPVHVIPVRPLMRATADQARQQARA